MYVLELLLGLPDLPRWLIASLTAVLVLVICLRLLLPRKSEHRLEWWRLTYELFMRLLELFRRRRDVSTGQGERPGGGSEALREDRGPGGPP